MLQYDYVIVGSGLTGAVFAHEAHCRGKKCLVLERRSHVGGNIYDELVDGIRVHRYGAHIFHTNQRELWDYVNRFALFNHYINSPIANYQGEIYNLPFNMNTFQRLWGVITPAEARARLEAQRVAPKNGEPANLEEQALALVGPDIYEKLIRGYTEKQWGRPCAQLPAFIIRRLPVRFTYDNNYFNDPFQGIPTDGYTALVQRLLEGSEVLLGVDFFADRAHYARISGRVIYTGMADEYFGCCEGALEYRSLRFEDKRFEEPNRQGVAVINYTDAATPYTRSIEHKHFLFGTQPNTIVTYEYPAVWAPGMEPYYPVNDAANQALYERYRTRMVREPAVLFAGRLAEYRYYDMDKAIAAALLLARREFGA